MAPLSAEVATALARTAASEPKCRCTRAINASRRARGKSRCIWSDGATLWVLEGGRVDAVYRYDLESGALVVRYALDAANG